MMPIYSRCGGVLMPVVRSARPVAGRAAALPFSWSWQYRNIVGTNRALVPGFLMPRQTNLYGVRWDFFN